MGSKARIVHEILPIMLDKEHDTFVDAFCGGCSVIENVPDTYRRIANDKNRYLIEMWKHLQNDGFVFSHISKETYDKARDCYHGKNNFFTEAGVGLVGLWQALMVASLMVAIADIMLSARTERQGIT